MAKKTGRPSAFSQAVGDAICERIVNGQSLRAICQDDAMPGASTVLRWLQGDQHVGFREQYTRARQAQAEAAISEITEIADAATNEDVQVAKLRVDTRKWAASKVLPKVYGERQQIEHTGENGGAVAHELVVRFVPATT